MAIPDIWLYIGFLILVALLLAMDLGVFNRTPHVVKLSEALGWTSFWVTLALAFNGFVYFTRGPVAATEFFAGYLLEQSLSVDNIFVIILILRYFKVAPQYHHKVLFWGILGAIVMRGSLIALGAMLLANIHWVFYVFGAFLVFTGIRMAFVTQDEEDIGDNSIVRFLRRTLRLTKEYHQDRFVVVVNGLRYFTPLMVVLIVVEITDLVFAIDSIPAIFAITKDTFIVFTSNIFAVMGLRSLFFVIAGVMGLFHYLKYGLSVILSLIGVKMIIHDHFPIPVEWTLGAIAVILGASIILSLMYPEQKSDDQDTAQK